MKLAFYIYIYIYILRKIKLVPPSLCAWQGLIETSPARSLPAPSKVVTVSGPLLQEVVHTFPAPYGVEQRIRLPRTSDVVHVRWR